MAQPKIFYLGCIVLLLAMVEATPPGLANRPSSATCKVKKYKMCYNLEHVCPKFCPNGCEVECASCKPFCTGSSGGDTGSSPPTDDSSPPGGDDSSPSGGNPHEGHGPSTPTSPSTPEYPPPSTPTPPTPSTPAPSTPSTPAPSTPSTPPTPTPSTPSPSTPSTPSYSPPMTPPTPTPATPTPSTPTPTPSTPEPAPSTPTPTPSTPEPAPSTPTPTPSTPSTPTPSTPSAPSTPTPTPSTPTPTPSTPTPTPSTPTPTPSTPTPTPSTPTTPTPVPTPSEPTPTPTPTTPTPSTPTPPSSPYPVPSTPSTPSPSTPTPSSPAQTPPTPTPSSQTPPSTPTPSPTTPSTPSPSTPSSPQSPPSSEAASRKRVRCKNKSYGPCYGQEHVCPASCPTSCQVDCVTCKPVCSCDYPGAVCQDPRFIGADGITFYFHGKKDKDFCLVTDPNLHINAHFIGKRNENMTRDFTWVQSIGILFDNHRLFVGAQKTSTWNDANDRVALAFDGEPIFLQEGEGSEWRSNTEPLVTVTRASTTNSIIVQVQGKLKISAKVVPITKEESRVHNYDITKEDCFAHLDLGFKFESLSREVDGVLGQTYRDEYVTRVNVGASMPVMGGERQYATSSLFATDCLASRFQGAQDVNSIQAKELSSLSCASGMTGAGVVCKR